MNPFPSHIISSPLLALFLLSRFPFLSNLSLPTSLAVCYIHSPTLSLIFAFTLSRSSWLFLVPSISLCIVFSLCIHSSLFISNVFPILTSIIFLPNLLSFLPQSVFLFPSLKLFLFSTLLSAPFFSLPLQFVLRLPLHFSSAPPLSFFPPSPCFLICRPSFIRPHLSRLLLPAITH